MIGAILIKREGAVPSNISKRNYNNNVIKPSWQETGEFFHKDMLPLRFTVRGGKMLGYTPRRGEEPGIGFKAFQRSYTGRKRRKFGHQKPLVFSGLSERLALIRDVRATSKGVRIVNHARALNFRNPKSKVNMADEVRRIAPREADRLTTRFGRRVTGNLRDFRKTTRTEI